MREFAEQIRGGGQALLLPPGEITVPAFATSTRPEAALRVTGHQGSSIVVRANPKGKVSFIPVSRGESLTLPAGAAFALRNSNTDGPDFIASIAGLSTFNVANITNTSETSVVNPDYPELGARFDAVRIEAPDGPRIVHLPSRFFVLASGVEKPEADTRDIGEYYDRFLEDRDYDTVVDDRQWSIEELLLNSLPAAVRANPVSVLSLGAGTGLDIASMKALAEVEPERIIAVDTSRKMLEKLQAKFQDDSSLEVITSTLENYLQNSDEQFRLVLCMDVMNFIPRLASLISKIVSHMKPGGYAIIPGTFESEAGVERRIIPGLHGAPPLREYYPKREILEAAIRAVGATAVVSAPFQAYKRQIGATTEQVLYRSLVIHLPAA